MPTVLALRAARSVSSFFAVGRKSYGRRSSVSNLEVRASMTLVEYSRRYRLTLGGVS